MRRYGFDDPRDAFESLVTALQGALLDEEYKCLSSSFRARNELSEHVYRAFRDEELARHPWLRWALARARVVEVVRRDERHARLRARIPIPFRSDPLLWVELVREDYVDLSLDGRIVDGRGGPPEEFDLVRDAHLLIDERDGRRTLWARVDPSVPLGPSDLDQAVGLRLGSEWRVDDYGVE